MTVKKSSPGSKVMRGVREDTPIMVPETTQWSIPEVNIGPRRGDPLFDPNARLTDPLAQEAFVKDYLAVVADTMPSYSRRVFDPKIKSLYSGMAQNRLDRVREERPSVQDPDRYLPKDTGPGR